jgi:hypothetical protein
MLTTSMKTDRTSQAKRNAEAVALKRLEELTAKSADMTAAQMMELVNTGYDHENNDHIDPDVENPGRHYIKTEDGYMRTKYRYEYEIFDNTSVDLADPDASFPPGFLLIRVLVGWDSCEDDLDPETCKYHVWMSNFVQPKSVSE